MYLLSSIVWMLVHIAVWNNTCRPCFSWLYEIALHKPKYHRKTILNIATYIWFKSRLPSQLIRISVRWMRSSTFKHVASPSFQIPTIALLNLLLPNPFDTVQTSVTDAIITMYKTTVWYDVERTSTDTRMHTVAYFYDAFFRVHRFDLCYIFTITLMKQLLIIDALPNNIPEQYFLYCCAAQFRETY